jgi:membrane-bound serine protease (ClpP class)
VSYLRARMRAISEGKGYRGEVVSAMIDSTKELKIDDKVIKEKGELLSLTDTEAMKAYGDPPQPLLGAGIAKTLDELLAKKFGEGKYTVRRLEITWSERLAVFLNSVAPILLGLGMLALFIEFKTPGFGIFGISGIALLAIVFLGNYVAGLSGHEPIIFFAVGLLLLGVEIFFIPGSVVVGLAGVALMLGSLVWSMADIWPNQPVSFSGDMFMQPLLNVGFGLLIAVVLALMILRFLPREWFWGRMVLSSAVSVAAQESGGPSDGGAAMDSLIGRRAVAVTALRPYGHVEIDGKRHEAQLEVGSLDAGANVVVTARSDFGLIVEKADT